MSGTRRGLYGDSGESQKYKKEKDVANFSKVFPLGEPYPTIPEAAQILNVPDHYLRQLLREQRFQGRVKTVTRQTTGKVGPCTVLPLALLADLQREIDEPLQTAINAMGNAELHKEDKTFNTQTFRLKRTILAERRLQAHKQNDESRKMIATIDEIDVEEEAKKISLLRVFYLHGTLLDTNAVIFQEVLSPDEEPNEVYERLSTINHLLHPQQSHRNAYDRSERIRGVWADWQKPNQAERDRANKAFLASPAYSIQTSQEIDILFRAVSAGKSEQDWHSDANALTRTYRPPKASHVVRVSALEDEIADGISESAIMEALERLTHEQDSDCVFALLYVSRLLAPLAPLPERTAPVDWIDLDDVIAKIGWSPRSTKEREEMRRKVWEYLRFGARAGVYGQRTGPAIIDKETGKPIDTTIDGPLWAFHDRIRSGLFDSINPPHRVEISMTRAWTALITSPQTAQYLPLGELLGSIPGEQPSGAWARCIGLALANLWRRQPQAVLDGTLQPTRRELLTRYTPKKAPPLQILDSTNPGFARKYWKDALQILVQNEFLADAGDAAQAVHVGGKTLPRQNWKDVWLDERVTLLPGPLMRQAVERSAIAQSFPPRSLPVNKPRRKKASEQ